MATQFVVTVKSAGGDYASLNAAVANTGIACDLTAATTKVFSINSVTGTPGASLTGQTSGATATLVKVNAAGTQALLKSISGGPFVSGETVQSSAGNSFVLANAGDSAIAVVQCYGMQDTTAASTGSSWVTSAANYLLVAAAPAAVAQVPYDSAGTAYRLETNGSAAVALTVNTINLTATFRQLQIQSISPASASANRAVQVGNSGMSLTFDRCYFKGTMHASNTTLVFGVRFTSGATSGTFKFIDCLWTDFTDTGNVSNTAISVGAGTVYIYNGTVYNCAVGVAGGGTATIPKNTLYSRAGLTHHTGFSGCAASSTNNASTESDAPGSNPHNAATFTFVDAAGGDYHLTSADVGALNLGADLRTDVTYPVTTDFDGKVRFANPSIGAFDLYNPRVVGHRPRIIRQR